MPFALWIASVLACSLKNNYRELRGKLQYFKYKQIYRVYLIVYIYVCVYKQSVCVYTNNLRCTVILKVQDINSCSMQKQLNHNESNLYTAYIWYMYVYMTI